MADWSRLAATGQGASSGASLMQTTPITTAAMPPSFKTISSDCTRPPKATVRQLISAEAWWRGNDLLRPNCSMV